MTLAFLFPGQGSQRPGMLHHLPDSPAAARAVREAADLSDTASSLENTTTAQLALLINGVAAALTLSEDHGLTPDFVAGHSVGAFAAAVTAGVLTLPEALEAVRLRGNLMRQACPDGKWGMAATIGLRLPAARALVESVTTAKEPLWIANINAATQIVLSGSRRALDRAEIAANAMGARRFEHLAVTVASHGLVQVETAERLSEHMAEIPRRRQRIPYLTNTRGRRVCESAAVLDDLARSVAQPVQWHDATRLMVELGVTTTVEMPPGHVLSRLMNTTNPDVRTIAFDEAAVEQVVHRIKPQPGSPCPCRTAGWAATRGESTPSPTQTAE